VGKIWDPISLTMQPGKKSNLQSGKNEKKNRNCGGNLLGSQKKEKGGDNSKGIPAGLGSMGKVRDYREDTERERVAFQTGRREKTKGSAHVSEREG